MITKIIPASVEHAPFIGKAITMAIGDELTAHLAGEKHTEEDVVKLFSTLARRTDSQYSYLNSMVAINDGNSVAGVVVAYDGANLHELRKAFFEEAEKAIGLKISGMPQDETGPEEFYLDTLAVFPEYRGKGIATRLIKAAGERAEKLGKPLGLLVGKTNSNAQCLYESLGFQTVGERPFAGELMNHLVLG